MNTSKDQSLLFANEDAIFRIVSIARIVSWIILSVYLVVFVGSINSMIEQGANFPTQFMDWLNFIANMLYPPALGLFYFLVLQGLAQGLSLGLDAFYTLNPEEDDDEQAEVQG